MSSLRKRSLTIRVSDEWIAKCIDEIVKTKREMGYKSSFSYELMRLAKCTLTNTLAGTKLDLEILRDKTDDS